MIDVSDGLHADLKHLLVASGLGAELSINALPLSEENIQVNGQCKAVEMALNGGDDYELCFTVPADKQQQFEAVSESWDCTVTRIGTTVSGDKLEWVSNGGTYDVPDSGFSHFDE